MRPENMLAVPHEHNGGAWYGDVERRDFAIGRIETAYRNGHIGDIGWNELINGRGCLLELITGVGGEDAIPAAGVMFNFPERFSTHLYGVFDNHPTLGGRSRLCRTILPKIGLGTDLEEVIDYIDHVENGLLGVRRLENALWLFDPTQPGVTVPPVAPVEPSLEDVGFLKSIESVVSGIALKLVPKLLAPKTKALLTA